MELKNKSSGLLEVEDVLNETIHEDNVSNFETLVSICSKRKEVYSPTKEITRLRSLNNLLYMAKNSIDKVEEAFQFYNNAVLTRATAFASLESMVKRAIQYIENGFFFMEIKEQAQRFYHEITKHDKTLKESISKDCSECTFESITIVQKVLDNWMERIDQFNKFVVAIPGYCPDDMDINIPNLIKQYYYVKGKNAGVTVCLNQLRKAMNARDYVLYTPETGLVDVARSVLDYMQSHDRIFHLERFQILDLKFEALN